MPHMAMMTRSQPHTRPKCVIGTASNVLWPNEPVGMTALLSPDPYQYPYTVPLTNNTPLNGVSGLTAVTADGFVVQVTDNTQPIKGNGYRFTVPLIATTGSATLSATATGYHRADGGSFITNGFFASGNPYVSAAGFGNSGNNGGQNNFAHQVTGVTATDITCTGCSAEGAGAGRVINQGFTPGAPGSGIGLDPGSQPAEMFTGAIMRFESDWPLSGNWGIGKHYEHWFGGWDYGIGYTQAQCILTWEFNDVSGDIHFKFYLVSLAGAYNPTFTTGEGSAAINPGEWFRIEMYSKRSSVPGTSTDGIFRLWVSTWDGSTRDGSGNAVWGASHLDLEVTDAVFPITTGDGMFWEYHQMSAVNDATAHQAANILHMSIR